ncbi:hypothetical protein G6F40_013948 [Rhizopus arrhizus]|nr:hypothetical protein G6F40_013948 [Rhizopus arrhizus]
MVLATPLIGVIASRTSLLAVAGVDAVADIQVVTFGLGEAGVAVAELQAGDDAVGRVTGEAAAACFDALLIAILKDLVRAVTDDGVVDADLPPVQRNVEVADEGRAPHQAQRLAGRGFRNQQRIGTGHERRRGCILRRGHRDIALLQLAEVGSIGDVTCAARADFSTALGRAEHGVARVAELREGFRTATVQVVDGRGAEAFSPGTTDQQLVDRLPLEAELAVEGIAEGVVLGEAGGGIEAQFARAGQLPPVGPAARLVVAPVWARASGV